jgi:hypothetical protein
MWLLEDSCAGGWVTAISGVGYLFGRTGKVCSLGVKRFDLGVAIIGLLTAAFLWWRNRRENGATPRG